MTSQNIAVSWVNLFDSAVITTSSAATSTPASNLQQSDVARKWRGTAGATETITATWSSDQTADTFALMGVGDAVSAIGAFLATGTVRLQLTSNGGSTGDVYDSGTVAGIVDPLYHYAVHLLTSKTFRSAKWTLTQAAASYVEAGRGFVGARTQFTYNAALGAQRTVVDPSTKKKTDGGQTKIRVRPKYRVVEFDMRFVSYTERWSVVEAMDIANGASVDVLMILDPTSTNLGRDCIFGTVDSVSPVITPVGVSTVTDTTYSRSFRVEERL